MNEAAGSTVVLADDHNIVREGIAALCAHQGFRVVGQCADGEAAVDMIRSLQPEFALLDVHMPGLTGLEVIRKLRAQRCPTKLIVLSISREEALVRDALRAGADAYLLKDGPSRHLVDAVSFIREGGVYVSPLLKGAGLFAKGEPGGADGPLACLSAREAEVFSYLVNGFRAKDIAQMLNISPKTVDTYRAGLMRKLNVRDLVSLVKFAIENKLTSTSDAR